jgi:hypothetical protein
MHNGIGAYMTLQTLALIASGITGYLVIRKLGNSKTSSLLASLFYCLSAYRFVDMFIRNALGEHVAFVVIPPILYVALQLIERRSRNRLLHATYLALLIGALVLTNVPIAVCIALVCGVYWVYWAWKTKSVGELPLLILSGVLGSMIAGMLILPALYAKALTQYHYLDKHGSHHALIDLFTPSEARIGVHPAVISLLILGMATMYLHWKRNLRTRWMLILLCSIVLQLPLISDWMYTSGLLSIVQTSTRFTAILTFCMAALIAQGLDGKDSRPYYWVLISSLLISLGFYGYYLRTDLKNGIRSKVTSSRNSVLEHLPITALSDSSRIAPQIAQWSTAPFIVPSNQTIKYTDLQFEGRSFELSYTSPVDQSVKLHHYYWPLWSALLDGKKIELRVDSEGIMEIDIPQGSHRLQLHLEKSEAEIVGEYLSLIGVASTLCLLIFARRMRVHKLG